MECVAGLLVDPNQPSNSTTYILETFRLDHAWVVRWHIGYESMETLFPEPSCPGWVMLLHRLLKLYGSYSFAGIIFGPDFRSNTLALTPLANLNDVFPVFVKTHQVSNRVFLRIQRVLSDESHRDRLLFDLRTRILERKLVRLWRQRVIKIRTLRFIAPYAEFWKERCLRPGVGSLYKLYERNFYRNILSV